MNTSYAGQLFIKSFESLSLSVYDDNGKLKGGYPTIGWGHRVVKGEEVLMNGINEDQAEQLFWLDLQTAEKIVKQNIKVILNQNQFDSLVSFAFNTGKMSITLKTLIETGASQQAIKDFWQSHYITSDGITLNGLIRRRKAESENYFKIQNALT